MKLIEHHKSTMSIAELCRLLSVSRSSLYYEKKKVNEIDVYIMNEIRSIYREYPFFGYRRIREMLNRRGILCNRKKVQRLMRIMGLQALYPGKKATVPNKQHKKYPYLLNGLEITGVNQVWQVDITYIKLRSGYGYLVCLIDIYSRRIMGWAFSPFLDTKVCLEALESALKDNVAAIINSDQGSQFTSNRWVEKLKAHGIALSMDGKGRWMDNVFIERLWRTIKWEAVYLHSFHTITEAKEVLKNYILFYN